MNMRTKRKLLFALAIFLIAQFFLNTNVFAEDNESISFRFNLDAHDKNFLDTKDLELVPCGLTIGVRINTDGIIVLGTDLVKTQDGEINPSESLCAGDLILSANNKILNTKEDFIELIESQSALDLKIKRGGKINNINITPIRNVNGEVKIGAWVRDSTQGVGTLTYYNPLTNKFGALGHGVIDVDTQQLMTVKTGDIKKLDVLSVTRSELGNPGEILGNIKSGETLGDIKLNNEFGLYGTFDIANLDIIPSERLLISTNDKIHEGLALIKSNITGELKNYDAYIESVNKFDQDNNLKNMIIKITDQELLAKTNGIVQGMSGSPIIQDNKLIGAVTHVFVQDPSRGYGVFIENMLKQEAFI